MFQQFESSYIEFIWYYQNKVVTKGFRLYKWQNGGKAVL